jgi:hypothetical protein
MEDAQYKRVERGDIDSIEAAAQSFAALLVSHGHELARIQYIPSQSCRSPTYHPFLVCPCMGDSCLVMNV